ncbi:MAG: type II toxin-antitoxin system VapC family toxin [Gluconacetobacter diazotrophicus]|nr:type II toxin-antitoxin system VapC family toxin [Gluconacetobacter diazotrophicus]
MRILLDTHALLWWLMDDDRLGPKARALIADPANDVLISVVSFWEVALKIRIGKLAVDLDDVMAAVPADGLRLLDLRTVHLRRLMTLPVHHRDPFDHLLIAQAREERATFMSEDDQVARYPVDLMRCSAC